MMLKQTVDLMLSDDYRDHSQDERMKNLAIEIVRKMHDRLIECFDNEVEHMGIYTESQVLFVVDNIAKEMLQIEDCIANAPTSDVVKVVRCKDCEYGVVDVNENTWCTFYNGKIREMPNGYCWHGEKRRE